MSVLVNRVVDAGADGDLAPHLLVLRVRAAFNESRFAIELIFPVVVIAVVLLWTQVEHWRLVTWSGVLAAAYGARLLLYAAYARGTAGRSPAGEQRWADTLTVALAVVGLAWSALYWLVAAHADADGGFVSAAVLMAVAGVALGVLSTLPVGYAVFTSTMLLPPALMLAGRGGWANVALAVTLVLYVLTMSLLAVRTCRQFEQHALLDIARLRAEARFRDIAVASGDWFWEGDAEGRLTWISDSVERITGTPPAWFIGRRPQDMIVANEPLDAQVWEAHRQTRERHQPYRDFRYRMRHPNGDIWISNSGTPRFDARGSFLGYRGATTDISERKRTEIALGEARDAAQTANVAQSQFLANMSHEIRTPMNGVLGMTALLLDEPLTVTQRRRAEAIRSSGEALLKIIDDILDLSKIEANKLVLESVSMDLRALVEHVRVLLEPACAAKGVAFECVIAPALPALVQGDPMRLRQVLINLVGNAVKFTTQGRVRVAVGGARAGDDAATVHFDIIDTGRGIAAAVQGVLFASFTQADASISREYGGTGLGLAISRQLVQAMGGRIGLESASGQGSRFWFALPMPAAGPSDRAAKPASASADGFTGLRFDAHILLAEDNEINQEVARGALIQCGCRVTVVGNGREALEAIARTSFDLVLMDCQMPEIDGLAATRVIRQAEQGGTRHLPVVALTANAFVTDRDNCLAAGMDDYISKPFSRGEIAAVLQRWLAPARDAGMPSAANPDPARPDAPMPALRSQVESGAAVVEVAVFDPAALARLRAYQVAGEEDLVTGVLKRFLGGADVQIKSMRSAMERDDFSAAGAAAHGMKASAAFSGAPRLSAACAQLDIAGRGDSATAAKHAFAQVQREYAAAVPLLQAALSDALLVSDAGSPQPVPPVSPTTHTRSGPS